MVEKKNLRHREENYYSVRAILDNGQNVVVSQWDGNLDSLAAAINSCTNKKWKKIRILKYTQCVDLNKKYGSPIVGKKHAMLKIDRIGCGSLCTKVDENLMRNGAIPQNILAFFGKHQK